MRDLVTLDAAVATPLAIVAAQFRRQVTSLPSKARTDLIALVAMQATRGGRIDANGRELIGIMEEPGLGRDMHLTIGSTRMVEGALRATIRIVGAAPSRRSPRRDDRRFLMTVSPDAVELSSAGWP